MNNLCFYCKEQDYSINTCKKKVIADIQNAGCSLYSSLSDYCNCANPCGLHYKYEHEQAVSV
jgi:hypothetical protein